MIISDEQARLALQDLHNKHREQMGPADGREPEVSTELMRRISESLAVLPETRLDRVEKARADLEDGCPSADDVAGKMLARIISDSLR